MSQGNLNQQFQLYTILLLLLCMYCIIFLENPPVGAEEKYKSYLILSITPLIAIVFTYLFREGIIN